MNKESFKIIHLLTHPTDEREIRSIRFAKRVAKVLNCDYEQNINELYTKTPPAENCKYPKFIRSKMQMIKSESGGIREALAPGQYGCFLAHKQAILNHAKTSSSSLIVFECDAVASSLSCKYFKILLPEIIEFIKEKKIKLFSFGGTYGNEYLTNLQKYENFYLDNVMLGTHAYFIHSSMLQSVVDVLDNALWDAMDIFYSENLSPIGTYIAPLSVQGTGKSLLTGLMKQIEK